MPLAYIPKSLANTVRPNPVIAIFLCAYEAGAVSAPQEPGSSVDDRKTNHWVMYLSISSAQSIRLDPSPTSPGNSLDLIITMDSSHTNHAVKIRQLTPTANLTVGHVLDCITNAKYDKYIFSTGGQDVDFGSTPFWHCCARPSVLLMIRR
jgi:hypothetical protein